MENDIKRTPAYGPPEKHAPKCPLVTVVTIVLNDPEGLEQTIRSIRQQTYERLEYIVIDGGSKAPTLNVINIHADSIDRWISEPDRGIYDAMNKGIDLATGEWISFMNAGDCYYDKEVLSTVFSQDFGEADFIYGHTNFLSGDFTGIVKAWEFDILWKTMIFTHQSSFTRAELLKKRKFNPDFKICGDFDVIYNAYMDGRKFHNADTVISTVSFGVSEVNRARMAVEKWKVVRRHRNDLRFHWFYLTLVVRRCLRDIRTRIARRWENRRP
jgi:glycosyltransferase involved in cell wall biosynthesis